MVRPISERQKRQSSETNVFPSIGCNQQVLPSSTPHLGHSSSSPSAALLSHEAYWVLCAIYYRCHCLWIVNGQIFIPKKKSRNPLDRLLSEFVSIFLSCVLFLLGTISTHANTQIPRPSIQLCILPAGSALRGSYILFVQTLCLY